MKYLFAVLVSIYLLNSVGIPVYYHYCCGELESVSPLFKSNSCCGEEEEEDEDSGCCQNETGILAQVSENPFYSADYKLVPLSCESQLAGFQLNLNVPFIFKNELFLSDKFEFPPGSGRDILQKISVLII